MSYAHANDDYDIHKDRVFQEPYTLFVGNLPPNTVQGDLETIFFEIKSEIKNIRIIRDKETDAFKGFCYVEFASEKALRLALSFDSADYLGYILKIDYAEPRKKDRSVNSRNSGGGGSTTGSQSGSYRNQSHNNNNYNSRGGGMRSGNYQDNGRGKGYYNNNGGGPRGGYMQQSNYNHGGGGGGGGGSYQNQGGQRGYNNNYGGGYHQGGGPYHSGNSYNHGGNTGDHNRGGQTRGYNNRYQRQDQRTAPPPLEPLPDSEGRPKLELKKRAVDAPTAALADTKSRSKIFGNALPREFNAKVTIKDDPEPKKEAQEQQQKTSIENSPPKEDASA